MKLIPLQTRKYIHYSQECELATFISIRGQRLKENNIA